MISTDTAMHAIRILGVDLANSATKLAVYQATVEELSELALAVDERAWEPTAAGVILPSDQHQVLQQILMLIDSLR